VIFSDRSLYDLVAKKPRTKEELLGVFGFGQVKCERHGGDIIAVIKGD
jgi:superfamily II DNA helicase RecQ